MQELSEAPEDMTTHEWWSVLCVNTKGGMGKNTVQCWKVSQGGSG